MKISIQTPPEEGYFLRKCMYKRTNVKTNMQHIDAITANIGVLAGSVSAKLIILQSPAAPQKEIAIAITVVETGQFSFITFGKINPMIEERTVKTPKNNREHIDINTPSTKTGSSEEGGAIAE